MNPYLQTGLAMCLIVLLALAATAYLAVYFNRRAKADLQAALDPLAELIHGSVDLDTATVTGTFEGQIVAARMANAEGGVGRVFQTELVDPAGGDRWVYTSAPPRERDGEPRIEFDSDRPALRELLPSLTAMLPGEVADAQRERLRLSYDPDSGCLRMVKGMKTRRDIPDTDHLHAQLSLLHRLGDENRAVQQRLHAETTEPQRP